VSREISELSQGVAPAATFDVAAALRDHGRAMFHLAQSMLQDAALAEDTVQEAIVRAWQSYASFRHESSLRTWLLTITRNQAVSAARRRRDIPSDPDQMAEPTTSSTPEDAAVTEEASAAAWRQIARLDPLSRSILILHDVDGETYQSIAEILNVPMSTVRTRLFRARRTITTSGVNR
jgi:RNA polymerase sigma-70 factor (ECF subfamily)